ncbi:methyltransferase domain-containing protein [Caldichromatium japonicum]|uniref:Methyltransferase domain-containing protein n=1 Tax=Caldichromatium japonicum TaxID=2699430 RepID=A0A6G7VAQ1_9GAMM|nr:class I SAM-dependent methyltransferase [Caldichromatium japonicum]QIK37153.1 methyltransferase domain-containing protein [Caldichromatium japonicum]
MCSHQSLTQQAHDAIVCCLQPGDWALDATAGNGRDTLFLARQVGPSGHVWAFDVQSEALKVTEQRLRGAGCAETVSLIQASHDRMLEYLPAATLGQIKAIQFNLGYRPGGDKRLITRPQTTLPALTAACRLLHPEGLLSLLVYRGHPGGMEEYQAILAWLDGAGLGIKQINICAQQAPVLFLLRHSSPH